MTHSPEEITDLFILSAKEQWAREADTALRRIAKLRWWERWKAKRIAQECLGIGPFWDKGFRK